MDVPLAETGIAEANRAANNLKEEGFTFDIMCVPFFQSLGRSSCYLTEPIPTLPCRYTSLLQRAIKTGLAILEVSFRS